MLNPPRKPAAAHFKVLQWNVLADGLAQNGDFCMVPPSCLEWEYRKPLLLQELLEADADIICLQELNHFDELRQALGELGYDGAFREKHASPALKYEYPPDGMAVFYRRSRFSVVPGGVEGRSFQDDCTGREQSQGYLAICLADRVVGDARLLVVTTHLKAKDGAECEELRFQQAQQLLRNIAATLDRLQGEGQAQGLAGPSNGSGPKPGPASAGSNGAGASNGNGSGAGTGAGSNGAAAAAKGGGGGAPPGRRCVVPVVVTGDFNTLPGSKTCRAFREHPLRLQSLWEQLPLDATLSSGSDVDMPPLPPAPPAPTASHPPAAPAPTAPQPPALSSAPPYNGSATASTLASSSYMSVGEEFSTWKFRVKGESKRISDYIYFTGCGALRPLSRWRMLTEEEIGPDGLPNRAYGSDHVSLCCEFEWDTVADLEWAPTRKEAEWG
ncbi:hypothetical protein HYH03_006483 [Edaphochlamys debaryana]|uniref:Endonuclease/exonuclease/phosphatase domain-containing protein n=1 Tax=Edaphochlamys debaryana TaxID=47281 RepID=A0A835Y3U3_9CHLO|nr:hypothetical protein HYH03_006483 [Edaphochlamys debaryana]|eukprot:KAG2495540.1 hypothetical protein HYH03_006483 [Edaphochlamys debaryana]